MDAGAPPKAQQPNLKTLVRVPGLPLLGNTLSVLTDPMPWADRMREAYGDTFIYNVFFLDFVGLTGPDALEFVLTDRGKQLSTAKAYAPFLGWVHDTSLLLQDHDEHRAHRQRMTGAFKADAMKGYLAMMNAHIPLALDNLPTDKTFAFYPAIKQLTLDIATRIFLGFENHPELARINKALTDLLGGTVSLIRARLPGTAYKRTLDAKDYLDSLLRAEMPKRRQDPGPDMFSYMCTARDEDGAVFTDHEIIGHMLTFWVGGHDTLASSLTTLVYHLAKNPAWQDRLREEGETVIKSGTDLTFADLETLNLTECAFKEALRIMPPVLNMNRVALDDLAYDGFHIPKGSRLAVSIYQMQHDPAIWPDPETFDPMRFMDKDANRQRHRYAWSPFGGGAHMCIGLHFAMIQAKAVIARLLQTYRITVAPDYEIDYRLLPTPRPKDGLPLVLSRL